MPPRPRRPSAPARAALKRLRDAQAEREARRAQAALEGARREVEEARRAVRRREGAARYDALVDRGLAFDSAGGRPPPSAASVRRGRDTAEESIQPPARFPVGGSPP